MAVSSSAALPEKDFKAQVVDGKIMNVGVDIFNDAMEAQALYKLNKADWKVWLNKITEFCETGNTGVYAENALNELNGAANISALDVKNLLCSEIDNLRGSVQFRKHGSIPQDRRYPVVFVGRAESGRYDLRARF